MWMEDQTCRSVQLGPEKVSDRRANFVRHGARAGIADPAVNATASRVNPE